MKTGILEFYVNKFNYFDNADELDLSHISPIVRRRMSALDKITLSNLDKTYTDDIQYIVFSSQFGEVDRLLKIIDQYTENKEVSPNMFSGSVHNYPVSFFILNKKISIPYTATSAGDNSISSSLLVSLISNYDNVLFCHSDVNLGNIYSLAMNISKKPKKESTKYVLKTQNNDKTNDSFENYIKFFKSEILTIQTQNYTIERQAL